MWLAFLYTFNIVNNSYGLKCLGKGSGFCLAPWALRTHFSVSNIQWPRAMDVNSSELAISSGLRIYHLMVYSIASLVGASLAGFRYNMLSRPPTSCRSCSTRYGMLWMMNPNNPLSTCTFHCTECWKEYGGVPAKAVGFPWPAGVAASGPPRSVLSNFGLPKKEMVQPYTACQQKKAALEHNGATCHNFVDATNGKAVLEQLGIDKVDVGVWGSPHPRTFNALFPGILLQWGRYP